MLAQRRRGLLPQPARRRGCALRGEASRRREREPDGDLELLRRHEPILRFTDGELFFPMAAELVRRGSATCSTGHDPARSTRRRSRPASSTSSSSRRPATRRRARRSSSGSCPSRSTPSSCGAGGPRPEHQRFSAPGPARAGRPRGPARRRRARHVAAAARPRAGWHGRRGVGQVRRDPGARPARRLPRPGHPRRPLGRPPLHVLLRDERLALDVRGRQRPRGRPRAVLRRAARRSTTATIEPAWFCAAAHDEKGDDLRRRWDDPRLETIDGHPVVYPGAGSHATYLERGEYIMLLPFPGERNIRGPLDLIRRLWRDTLAQPDPGDLAARAKRALSVPFVDYARGDGLVVGPGGDVAWTPIVIGDEDGWVDRYQRPVGARHRRPVRRRARAGRPEVHPDRLRPPVVARPARLRRPRQGGAAVAGGRRPRGADRGADARTRHAVVGRGRRAGRLAARSSTPRSRRSARTAGARALSRRPGRSSCASRRGSGWPASASQDVELGTAIAAGHDRLAVAPGGSARRPAAPSPPRRRSPSRRRSTHRRAFGEAWAAVSVGLLIAALAVIVWFRILPPPLAIVVLLGSYLAIESFFDRNVVELVLRITVVLAMISALDPRRRRTCASCSSSACSRSASSSSSDNLGEVRRRSALIRDDDAAGSAPGVL